MRAALSWSFCNCKMSVGLQKLQWRGGRRGRGAKTLEGRNITSQRTIFAVLQEKKLNLLLPSTNLKCIENHLSPSSLPPMFLWLSEIVGISFGFMLDSQGHWSTSAFEDFAWNLQVNNGNWVN